jgi:hypothetical protein
MVKSMQAHWVPSVLTARVAGVSGSLRRGLVAGALATCLLSGCRDLWVGKTACDDARPASANTEATPWCTLGRAASQVRPGDTVHVHAGVYTGSGDSVLRITKSGTPGYPIRFVAVPGETVEITPAGGAAAGVTIYDPGIAFVEVNGFHIRDFSNGACLYMDSASDIRLRNLDISGCTGRGALSTGHAQRFLIEGCRVHDNATHAWASSVGLWTCRGGNVVRGNMIWNNQDDPWSTCAGCADTEGHGIMLDTCETAAGTVIENNVIWNQEGSSIVVFRSNATAGARAMIRNNTTFNNGRRPNEGELNLLGSYFDVYNNIFVPRAGALGLILRWGPYTGGYPVDPTTLREGADLVWAPTHANVFSWGGNVGTLAQFKSGTTAYGFGQGSLQVDPRFVNSAGANFALQAGSPAIDAGDAAHAAATDFTGASRTAPVNIGAY